MKKISGAYPFLLCISLLFIAFHTLTAQLGEALAFDGVDDRVVLPDGLLEGAEAFTLSFWAKVEESNQERHLFEITNSATDIQSKSVSVAVGSYHPDAIYGPGVLILGNGSGATIGAGQGTIAPNEWHHFYLTFDPNGSFPEIILYVDDRPTNLSRSFFQASDYAFLFAQDAKFYLGHSTQHGLSDPTYFKGQIANLRITTSSINCYHVTQQSECALPSDAPDLLALYEFNQEISMATTELVATVGSNGVLEGFSFMGSESNFVAEGPELDATPCMPIQTSIPMMTSLEDNNFGEVALGETQMKTFELVNTGNSSLTITDITSGNSNFALSMDYSGMEIPAGESVDIGINFTPSLMDGHPCDGYQNYCSSSDIIILTSDCINPKIEFFVNGKTSYPGGVCTNAQSIDLLLGQPVNEAQTSDLFDNSLHGFNNELAMLADCVTDMYNPKWRNIIWFTFTGDGNTYDIRSIACNAENYIENGNTQAAIFKGSCDALIPVACNEDEDTDNEVLNFLLNIPTEEGLTYYMVVDGFDFDYGEFCLEVTQRRRDGGIGFFRELRDTPFEGVDGSDVAFKDINNDGRPDVLLSGYSNNFQAFASLYINEGNGTFTEVMNAPFEGWYFGGVDVADINNDNRLDVLITGTDDVGMFNGRLYINQGGNNFTAQAFVPATQGDAIFVDVDGQNGPDVIVTGVNASAETQLYLNDGSGNFTLFGTNLVGVFDSNIAFADINNDNFPDVLLSGSNPSNDLVTILYTNDGNGNFTEVADTPFEGVDEGASAFADVDKQNGPDLLLTGRNSAGSPITKLYLNDGSGHFTEVSDHPFEEVNNSAVAFADVNGDDFPDVLITGNGENSPIAKLYTNNGDGTFVEVSDVPFQQSGSGAIAFADYDGDQDQDVIITGFSFELGAFTRLYYNGKPANPEEAEDGDGHQADVSAELQGISDVENELSGQHGSISNSEQHESALALPMTDTETTAELRIYPNPTKGLLYLENVDTEQVNVFNATGQLVLSVARPGNRLDLSSLPVGVYLLRVEGKDRVYSVRVVME